MSSRRPEFSRRAVRWLWPASLLALTPKCLLCVFAYAGFGAALGLGGPEICGGSAGSPAPWASSLAWLGVAGGLATFGLLARFRPDRPKGSRLNSQLSGKAHGRRRGVEGDWD